MSDLSKKEIKSILAVAVALMVAAILCMELRVMYLHHLVRLDISLPESCWVYNVWSESGTKVYYFEKGFKVIKHGVDSRLIDSLYSLLGLRLGSYFLLIPLVGAYAIACSEYKEEMKKAEAVCEDDGNITRRNWH